MNKMQERTLISRATKARRKAYAPYSKFAVGAAVITEDGTIFDGSNVENASYGGTMCAERVAIFKAVSAGKKRIAGLAITANYPAPLPPCGLCRQVLSEFAQSATPVILANTRGSIDRRSAGELLPLAFAFPKRRSVNRGRSKLRGRRR
jgi:cytidine deaminase